MRFLVLPAILSLLLSSCGDKPEAAPQGPPAVVLPAGFLWLSPQEAAQLKQTKPALGILDVRDRTEREALQGKGWIEGSELNAYFAPNHRDELAKLDRTKPWLVYCALGGRSELTAQQMAELGFKEVYLLKGGFNAWCTAGLPTVK